MISAVHDESRNNPAASTLRSTNFALYSGPNPHQPVPLDTRGSTARLAHLEETVATPEIKRPDEKFGEIGRDPVRHLLRPFALHE
jgi:hypothetical protein